MNERRRLWLLASVIAAALSPGVALAQSSCGETTRAAAGETLTEIAERCDVAIEALRDANPTLTGDAVAAGMEVAMPESTMPEGADAAANEDTDIIERAGDLIRDAGREIEDAARAAGQSVSDYLSGNPDIGRDIREFGERYGLPGFGTPDEPGADAEAGASTTAAVGANITLTPASPRAGEEVTISATGLRAGAAAEIAIGPTRTEYEVIAQATSDAAGRVETTFTLPDWTNASDSVVFVVETENVTLRSDPVVVGE